MNVTLFKRPRSRVCIAPHSGETIQPWWDTHDDHIAIRLPYNNDCFWCYDPPANDNEHRLRFQTYNHQQDCLRETQCCITCVRPLLRTLSNHEPTEPSARLCPDGGQYAAYKSSADVDRNTYCLGCHNSHDNTIERYELGSVHVYAHVECWATLSSVIDQAFWPVIANNADKFLGDFL